MFVLVSYDIVEDRRRSKIANTLKNYGKRVQYSVFECILEEDKMKRMIEIVIKLMNKQEDSVRVYQLCDSCSRKIQIYGTGKITEDEEMFII